MKTRFLRGTTAQLNGLTLGSGHLAIDTEKRALRLFDGATLGGFEVPGVQAYEPPTGPGPTELIAGDMELGFYGEVSSAELLTYGALSTEVGFSAGTLINDSLSIWLKFSYKGKLLYVARNTVRSGVTWNNIAAVNVVYPDTTQIAVGAHTFNVRLLTGGNGDPSSAAGGEWDALIYRVHASDPTSTFWATYTDAELSVRSGTGHITWCQETDSTDNTLRVRRGFNSLTGYAVSGTDVTSSYYAWRPVLELVS